VGFYRHSNDALSLSRTTDEVALHDKPILAVLRCVQPDARSLALIFAVHSRIQALREIDNTKLLELFAVPFADRFPFAFLGGFPAVRKKVELEKGKSSRKSEVSIAR
jgi:hypothetical protein